MAKSAAEIAKNVKEYRKQLLKLDGAIRVRVNPYRQENIAKFRSPSMNWLFGNGHGPPLGHGVMFWGEPKCGKSLLTYDLIRAVQAMDPEYMVVKFDTEYRDDSQMTDESAAMWGVDLERLITVQKNTAKGVFDQIQVDIAGYCQAGIPVKMIAIDSISGIQGLQEESTESIEKQNMGDHAKTTKRGLKRILPVQKENKILLACSTHATAEMDQWEQKRNGPSKAAASYGIRHHCEYFVNVERVKNADGKKDLLENELLDNSRKGMDDKGEKTGHKIKVWMQDSTVGPQDRVAQFTFDYKRGIINTNEEYYLLGKRWGIITRAGNQYHFNGQSWRSEALTLEALRDSKELQDKIAAALLAKEKEMPSMDRAAAESQFSLKAKLEDADEETEGFGTGDDE